MIDVRSAIADPGIRRKMLDVKRLSLDENRKYWHEQFEKPTLRTVFFELTRRCNERCIHCGSRAGENCSTELGVDVWKNMVDKLKADFGTKDIYITITGGEPLLYRDFYELVDYIHSVGYRWGMTTNGTLIDVAAARKIADAGCGSISISIDGTEEYHDQFRRVPNSYNRAFEGLQNLIDVGIPKLMVTTVMTPAMVPHLDDMFEKINQYPIDAWRIVQMEPIGRALDHPELMCSPDDIRTIFEFIRDKRIDSIPVVYGCSHYLDMEYEGELRDWFWFCLAGKGVASISAEGDILGCLNIARNDVTIQGNILRDDFTDVWRNRFKCFRQDLSELNDRCRSCEQRADCFGGACHTFDFEKGEQRYCFKDVLF